MPGEVVDEADHGGESALQQDVVLDRETAELVRHLRGRPDVARLLTEPDLSPGIAPVVDLHFELAGTELRFLSVASTIGAPIDVTAQELRVEAFFPAGDDTRDRWASLEASERAAPSAPAR